MNVRVIFRSGNVIDLVADSTEHAVELAHRNNTRVGDRIATIQTVTKVPTFRMEVV